MHMINQRPATVTAAFWIWLMSAFVGVFSIVNVVVAGSVLSAAAAGETDAWVALITTSILIAAVLAVGTIVQIIAAVMFRDGARWARVLLVVAAVLSSAGVFASPDEVVSWVFLVANVVALVLSFLPASNEFFATPRRRSAAVAA